MKNKHDIKGYQDKILYKRINVIPFFKKILCVYMCKLKYQIQIHLRTYSKNVCMHIGDSINSEFCLRSWQLEALFTVAIFSRISIMMARFMSKKIVSIIFFTEHYTWEIFLYWRVSVFPLYGLFNSGSLWQNHV